MPYTKEEHQAVAAQMERDEHGHFVKSVHMDYSPADTFHPNREKENLERSENPESNEGHVPSFVKENVNISRDPIPEAKKDDLINIHVGNPLEKITRLLEDIKKQKAFAFTLKGSLGIAGVFLALGVFGVFGSTQMLCSHGTQSKAGAIKILSFQEVEKSKVPFLGKYIDDYFPQSMHGRIVLVKDGNLVVSVPYSRNVNFGNFEDQNVIVTGSYNSCQQTLTVNNPSAVEISE